MARYGMRDIGDTHGAGQRIVTIERPYGESIGLGKKIPQGADGEDILRLTETDFLVRKEPVMTLDGRRVPGTFAMSRSDNRVVFGDGRCVGKEFTPFQNHEMVAFVESLVDVADGQILFEAGGYLGDGATVWYQGRIPHSVEVRATELGSDTVEPFIFAINAHNGTRASTSFFLGHRPFCNNQIPSILANVPNKIKVPHTRTIHARMEEARKVLRSALGFFEIHVNEMRQLDAIPMSVAQMREFAEKLIGETQESIAEAERTIGKAKHNRRLARRERLVELFSHGLGNVGRTRYDAFQAAAEFDDHHLPVTGEAMRLRKLVLAPDGLKSQALRLLRS